jgi:hypothetical protein
MLLSKKTPKFYTRHFVKMELEFVFLILGCVAIAVIAYTVYLNTLVTVKLPAPEKPPATTEANFIFFSSTHCPWSKKAHPQWDAFLDDMKKFPMTYGGNTVTLKEIDGDSQPDVMKSYNANAYPTFLLDANGTRTTMSTTPTKDGFRAFLIKMLGPEKPVDLKSSTK